MVPEDATVCDDVINPALTTVRKSPVTAIAITAPKDVFFSAMLFPYYFKSEVSSINKHCCPLELHNYITTQLHNTNRKCNKTTPQKIKQKPNKKKHTSRISNKTLSKNNKPT
jgi:hypothetical protein